MIDSLDLEDAAKTLASSEDYRVLRRLVLTKKTNEKLSREKLVAIVLDVETTGLDPEFDEVIELAMIKFNFDRSGQIGKTIATYQSLNQPQISITQSISSLTGITNEMVAGKNILETEVETFISNAAIIIAHNAAFDRPFCEKICPAFTSYAWGCSATEIPWRDEGISGSRLEYIAQSYNLFYDAHRASNDCEAVLQILSMQMPRSQQSVMGALLESARRVETRIFATGAPFELRIPLKRRGYRWNGSLNQFPRAWWRDMAPADVEGELLFLQALDAGIKPQTWPRTARDRFRILPG
ncbi:3'-5' exonuclease [Tardiphaga sp.]|uniref:3'-5' exonuclease n=1 Tax=Tardiphaga sp. TaxID=1926292 RepID=UPI002633C528|nr:3'-5' exonuclease [Tardiphaga sp.]MDB5617041.1 polymerase-3 subunit epsilon [Tardiphaga sp.]